MTLPDAPDAADCPVEPPADDRLTPLGPPPKVLSPLFWLMIALGAVCVLAGVAIALLGPRLYPRTEPPIAVVPR